VVGVAALLRTRSRWPARAAANPAACLSLGHSN